MAAWLPEDTETYIVTTEPATLRNLYGPGKTSSLGESMKLMSLAAYPDELLKMLEGTRFEMSVAGRRNFQEPDGIGIGQHEGCEVFKISRDQASALRSKIEQISANKETIEGLKVSVLEHEGCTWLLAVDADLLFLATDRPYLTDVLRRRAEGVSELRSAEELWQYVDTSAPVFAVRVFTDELRNSDALNFNDEDIVGYAMTLDKAHDDLRIVSVSASPEGFKRARGVWGAFLDQEKWNGTYSFSRLTENATLITLTASADGSTPAFLIAVALGHAIFV